MFHPKKFIRKTTKFERRIKKAPDMAEIRENIPNLQERPEKYLNSALEKLGIPENLKNQIKQRFENLRLRNAGLSGIGDPMPDLAGLIYFVCKQNSLWLKRETVADALGINKEMVTKGHKTIRSQSVTESLRDNNSNTRCPLCCNLMNYEGSFWKCISCGHSAYAYDLRKDFYRVNKTTINRVLDSQVIERQTK